MIALTPAATRHSHLKDLDYSVVQQCMHCGMCLPTCPTYDATKLERNSPRGRIALMRAIADGRLGATKALAEEMYFCLGCLACMTACPAGVNYAELFEHARAEAEQSRVLDSPRRSFIRSFTLRWVFMDLTGSSSSDGCCGSINSSASRFSCDAAAFLNCCPNGCANWRP